MLIGFKVRNFRSFRNQQAFSFSTSADETHASTHCIATGVRSVPRLLRSAIIFGPNGSGKTNFIHALSVMREFVLRSTIATDEQYADWYTPYRFGSEPHPSTEFDIDVLLGGIRYRYGFSFDSRRVRSERLLVYATGKSQRWFERRLNDAGAESWMPFSPNFNGPRAMWRDATRESALFLTTAAQLNSEQLQPLFRWFEHDVELLFPSEAMNYTRMAAAIQDATFKQRMLDFLHSADIHVDDVRVSESETPPGPASRYPHVPTKRPRNAGEHAAIEFSHAREDGSAIWLQSADESAGMQRLASLFGPLFAAIEHGRLLLIDEFDISLHPLVARYLIQLINDPEISTRGAQVLLTSQNTTLMDLNIFRRDEIWLAALDDGESSTLTSLLRSPVPPRKHELIAKSYLNGRFGAIPKIHATAQNPAFATRGAAPAITAARPGPESTRSPPAVSPPLPRTPR